MKLQGVFVAITTPFTRKGIVDEPALKKHLEWLAAAGVHGFVPAGTTGEGSVLSREERKIVIQAALSVARAKGLKVIAGCGGNHTEKVLELLVEAKSLGCDAALVVTPYYNKPTPRGLLAHYEHLATHVDIPIILYNVPSRTGVSLSVETTLKLFESPTIIGIKEASGQYGTWLQLSNEMNLMEKSLLAGDDDAFAVILALGGSGIISASANIAPHQFVQIYDFAKNGQWTEAFDLQKRLLPLVRSLFLETSPSPTKWALNKMGFAETCVRLPLVEITEATAGSVTKALKNLEILS